MVNLPPQGGNVPGGPGPNMGPPGGPQGPPAEVEKGPLVHYPKMMNY